MGSCVRVRQGMMWTGISMDAQDKQDEGAAVVRLSYSRQGRTLRRISRPDFWMRDGVGTGYRPPVLPWLGARANLRAGNMSVYWRSPFQPRGGEEVQ